MKKLASTSLIALLLAPACLLSAMEAERDPLNPPHRLIGPVSMQYLKTEAGKIHKNVVFDVKIIPVARGGADVAGDEMSFDPESLPTQVTLDFVLANFSRLKELLITWKGANLDGAKVELKASFDDPSQKFKVSGADYIDFKPEESA